METAAAKVGKSAEARLRLLEAAQARLLQEGYAGLSTRGVAEAAGAPLSQIHYHFGSKQGLVLALLRQRNEQLLRRQTSMFGQEAPLSARWLQACEFLLDDLNSGYVRVLQEIIAAGYGEPELAAAARGVLGGWFTLLNELAEEAEAELGGLAGMTPAHVACLVGAAFLGAESLILIGMDLPVLDALRAVGERLREHERSGAGRAG